MAYKKRYGRRKEYLRGRKLEEEHKDTYKAVKRSCKKGRLMKPKVFYGMIARDHIKEFPRYYTGRDGLIRMEARNEIRKEKKELRKLYKQLGRKRRRRTYRRPVRRWRW